MEKRTSCPPFCRRTVRSGGSRCYVVFILSAFPMDKELAVVLIESCCERRVVNGVADFSD